MNLSPASNLEFSPRTIRLARNLILTAAVVVLIFWLRRASIAIELSRAPARSSVPLDFTVVLLKFGAVKVGDTREDIEALWGPPTQRRGTVTSEFLAFDEPAWAWHKWIDPNQDRWVAVVFLDERWLAGAPQRAYRVVKQGF